MTTETRTRRSAAHVLWRLAPWAGPAAPTPAPAHDRPALDEVIAAYNELDQLIGYALAAPSEERLRAAARVVNGCGRLDDALDRAGVDPALAAAPRRRGASRIPVKNRRDRGG